jgi:riboflavin synthase
MGPFQQPAKRPDDRQVNVFTGIIETMGTIREFARHPDGARVTIGAATIAETARLGDSLAVDGACLTVAALAGDSVACDLSAETLSRTTLGALRVGARVNLERPLRLGDRVGGHLVSGHVDAVGQLVSRLPQGDGAVYRIRFPESLAPFLVPKGSVAVDGISLTVATLAGQHFDVAVIPYTLRGTTLAEKRVGARLNLEADLIGKYVSRLAAGRAPWRGTDAVTLTVLKEHGFA